MVDHRATSVALLPNGFGVNRMKFWQFLRVTAPEELPDLAREVEATLFDGVVLGDHVVFPDKIESPYPYSKDGKVLWDPNTPWPDIWVAIAAMAAVRDRALCRNRCPDLQRSCRDRCGRRLDGGGISGTRHRFPDTRQAL
jgi:hypothetical protein